LDSRLAAFQDRLAGSEVGQLIQNTCSAIRARIRNRRGRRAKPKALAGEQKKEWARERTERIQQNHPTRRITTEKQRVLAAWKSRWQTQESQKQGTQDYWDQIKRPPDPAVLQLHKNLHKAESAILVQLRTGRTGLSRFLHKARVPGHESDQCSCGTGPETSRHVLLHCLHEAERRTALKEAQGGQLDFVQLLDTSKRAAC
jgi:hypothetical protein